MNLEQNYLCKVLDEKRVPRFMVLCLPCRNNWRTGYKRVGTTNLACAQCGAAGNAYHESSRKSTDSGMALEA